MKKGELSIQMLKEKTANLARNKEKD